MLRKLLGTGLLLATLAGCTKLEGRTCASDVECGEGGLCDTSQGLCYAIGTEPEFDGGTCPFTCAEYEACTLGGCRPRFTALNIVSPANNAVLSGGGDGGAVQVSAQLLANPSYASTTQFPEALVFSATLNDGGVGGSFGTATRNGDTYTVPWTLPAVQSQSVALTAAHPVSATGLTSTVNVTADTLPPTFTISFSAPPVRVPGSTSQADQRDMPPYDTAFRRDEPVTVTVLADESASNVTLTVVGIGAGGAAGASQPPVTLAPAGSCPGGAAFCSTTTVDLSVPEMREFRGTMMFRVEGQDGVGNRTSASAGLKVTRWKWAFDGAAGVIKGSPAVGEKGSVYIATTDSNGKVFALNPDGSLKWPAARTVGSVASSLTVGAPRTTGGAGEYVYVAARAPASGGVLYALKGSDGSQVLRCPGPASDYGTGNVEGSLALGETVVLVLPLETAVGVYNGSPSRIVSIRPDAASGADQCITSTGPGGTPIPASTVGASVVMKGEDIFYGTSASRLTSYAIGTTTPRNNWPQVANFPPRGLALVGDKVYGGQGSTDNFDQGSLFSAPQAPPGAGLNVSNLFPTTPNSRVFNLAVGSGNVAFFGSESATPPGELVRLGLDGGGSPIRVPDVGALRAAPIIGENDRLYTLNTDGKLRSWVASTLAPLWEVPLGVGGVDVSPTLDCHRDGSGNAVAGSSLGALYVAADTKLYSFIVDSPGLVPGTPWPKFQRDVRNTGNPATPIVDCP